MSNFEANPKKLKEDILSLIHTREMALPDFQRDFVWQPRQTRDLIVSLGKRYPAGSLLRMRYHDELFAPRAFASAPPLNGHSPQYLILDGQQRLTSLYQALYGTGDYLYYAKLSDLVNGASVDDSIFYERRAAGEKQYGSILTQARLRILPLQVIFGGEGFYEWLDTVAGVLEADENWANLTSTERRSLREAYEGNIAPITNYEFPMITLTENTPLEAVCNIFETLNSTGVRLSVFDLLSARYFARGLNLRELWQNALETSALLADFEVDPYYLLQAISARQRNSVKRSDVLQLTVEEVRNDWYNVVRGMNEALSLLSKSCGILAPELLSYTTILVSLAAIFAEFPSPHGPAEAALKNRVKRWYWCSVFNQTYESNPTSQTVKDINEVKAWMRGGEVPETVRLFSFARKNLFSVTTKQRAVYRGVMCLLLRKPPLDFHKGEPIDKTTIQTREVDDHHVFPVAYLKTRSLPSADIDCIVNRTYINRRTNQIIGSNAPSRYLGEIRKCLEHRDLDAVLASHQLPIGNESSLARDDFDAFRQERATALYALIKEATGMNDVHSDDQDRSDRFTWHDGDVVWVEMPNARRQIIEVGKRVKHGQEQGVVQELTGEKMAVIVTDDGESHTIHVDELEPTE